MNKTIIIVAGLAAAVTLAVVLVWPQYQKLQALNSYIKNKQAELQSQEAYFSQIKETSGKLQEYSNALSKIANALPKDRSLASLGLAKFLQTSSAQTGLTLKKTVPGGTIASSAHGSFAETQIALQLSGPYEAFKNFLLLIENSSRIIEVQNIAVEIPSAESKESPTFTLNLKTFSY